MKTLILILLFSTIAFAQTKQDSVKHFAKLTEIDNKFTVMQRAFNSMDSLQIGRLFMMNEYRKDYVIEIRAFKKLAKPKAKK